MKKYVLHCKNVRSCSKRNRMYMTIRIVSTKSSHTLSFNPLSGREGWFSRRESRALLFQCTPHHLPFILTYYASLLKAVAIEKRCVAFKTAPPDILS